ncbi:hypothetical protein CYK80_14060 [Clostridium perfringens]|nr:hypothetical protein CYK80_14060 [Clostridium perfringens]
MWGYDYGIIVAVLLVLISIIYPLIKLIRFKAYDVIFLYILLQLYCQSFNGLIYGDNFARLIFCNYTIIKIIGNYKKIGVNMKNILVLSEIRPDKNNNGATFIINRCNRIKEKFELDLYSFNYYSNNYILNKIKGYSKRKEIYVENLKWNFINEKNSFTKIFIKKITPYFFIKIRRKK